MKTNRARQILLDSFWDGGSWRNGPAVAPDEFDIAKAAGYMFDPSVSTHDEAVTRAINVADLIELRDLAHAFVASLTSRRLEYRSALGSYAFARVLRAVLERILKVAATQDPRARPDHLERAIGKLLPSNRHERRVLLQILGFVGILRSSGSEPNFDRFMPFGERRTETELAYPFSAWRGADGIDRDAVRFWFPEIAGDIQ